jgi:hypothetical protein
MQARSISILLLAVALSGPAAAADDDGCPSFLPDLSPDCERQVRPEGSVMPMSFPYIFEDPYIQSGLNFVGIWHEFPSKSVFSSGQLGVMALQIRLALTEKLAFIATKDGLGFLDPDRASPIPHSTGLFNMTMGFKYAAWEWQDENRSAIITPSLRYEIPLGQRNMFQGHGSGLLIPAVTGAYQHGGWHVILGLGGHAPLENDDYSSNFFWNLHADHSFELAGSSLETLPFTHIAPFIELNAIHWTSSGNGSRWVKTKGGRAQIRVAPGFEGVDVVNLGNRNVTGNDYVTMAWGVRLPMNSQLSLGLSYERALSNRKDLTEQRLTTMVTWEM